MVDFKPEPLERDKIEWHPNTVKISREPQIFGIETDPEADGMEARLFEVLPDYNSYRADQERSRLEEAQQWSEIRNS